MICEHFMELQPKSFFDLNNFQNSSSLNLEQQYFQNTLHIFVMNQSLDEHLLDHIRTEDNIVVFSDRGNVDGRIVRQKRAEHFARKILFVTDSNLYLLKPSTRTSYVLDSLSLNANESIISNFVRDAFSQQLSYTQYNMNGSVLKTFFRQKGAHSFILFFNDKFLYFGPDGVVTEELGKLLNATVDCSTDFGLDYPITKKLFSDDYVYDYFINYYRNLITTNNISDFNRRLVLLISMQEVSCEPI